MKIAYFVAAFLVLVTNCYRCDPIACTRPNEEYQCGSACQTTCSNLGEPCPIVNIRCNDGCYCKEGFARLDAKNQQDTAAPCVEIANCPKN